MASQVVKAGFFLWFAKFEKSFLARFCAWFLRSSAGCWRLRLRLNGWLASVVKTSPEVGARWCQTR